MHRSKLGELELWLEVMVMMIKQTQATRDRWKLDTGIDSQKRWPAI